MAEAIFLLCTLVSVICTFALLRGYRRSKNALLLWSGICFSILFAANAFLCIDLILFPDRDLQGPLWRNLGNAAASAVLLAGLILELS